MKEKVLILMLIVSITTFALETNLTVKKITKDLLGREVKEEVENININDIIEYNFEIHNDKNVFEYELRPSIPIPNDMVVIENKMSPGNFEVSVDGNVYLTYPVLNLEGKPVDPSAYKKVRWLINEIKPQETINVSLRVRLKE